MLMDLYQDSFMGYRPHHSYGSAQWLWSTRPDDRGHITSGQHASAQTIKRQYQLERVAGANPDEFYSMHGDMNDWEYELVRAKLPRCEYFCRQF